MRKPKSNIKNRVTSSYKNGVILVVTLWLITIMSIFGLGLARISYSNYRFAKFRVNKFLSQCAVRAVVEMCKVNRTEDQTPAYDTASELPRNAEYKFGNVKVVYSMIDEERNININMATSTILKKLPNMNMDKSVAIANSELKPFYPKEELLLLDEIDQEDYLGIRDEITVYGNGRVNINTCSEETLERIGMKDELIRLIMEYRKGEDNKLNTNDDGIFQSNGTIVDVLNEEFYLSLTQQQDLVAFISKNLLDVRADNYRINADVYISDRIVEKYSIVISKGATSRDYYIREWKQY